MRRLAAQVATLVRPGVDIVLVFDGPPVELPADGLEVRFAARRGPDAADDAIVELAGRAKDVPLRVVTSDRALAARVRVLGAEVEGAGAFLRRLGAP
jgi:uncharacterized protein YaiI (UPF0178 family)